MPASPARTDRRDIHAEITAKLIAAIEADPGRPSMPWRRSSTPLFMPENALTKKLYNGINIVSLWVSAEVQGYSAPIWATYRQWAELGCQVRKGEKSSLVIFYKEYETEPDADNADDDGKRRVARASYVFNASQVDGYHAAGCAAAARAHRAHRGRRPLHSRNWRAQSCMAASAPSIVLRPTPSICRTKASSAAPIR